MDAITRRTFLASASAAVVRSQQARRPNILFCISDDQSWIHAGAYGSKYMRTHAFDFIAEDGVLFQNAFVSCPSCAPSRASALTGQEFYRLGSGAMNHTAWPHGIPGYPDILASSGYYVGFTGKGWAPGSWTGSGRSANPCGPEFNEIKLIPPDDAISETDYTSNFAAFLEKRPEDTPFCFWAGFVEPHRILAQGLGVRNGYELSDIEVPAFLPDTEQVRSDIADYAFEIEWFNEHLQSMIKMLQKAGELENTLIIVTSDNGMAFPRAKGNLYEYGTHVPLALRWGTNLKNGVVREDLVSLTDVAPTILEAAGVSVPLYMTGRSLLKPGRESVVFGIERHFPGSRPNGAGYPSRAIRTNEYLYIHNIAPDRNPVGDLPSPVWPADDPVGGYGDTDGSPTKTLMWKTRQEHPELYKLAFGKRPGEELYSVKEDLANLKNLAALPQFASVRDGLRSKLQAYMRRTADPRITGQGHALDAVMSKYPVVPAAVSRQEMKR